MSVNIFFYSVRLGIRDRQGSASAASCQHVSFASKNADSTADSGVHSSVTEK